MATNKPEYVDLISAATRQHRRRATPLRIAKPEVEETSKLSRWPPAMFKQWKIENLMRWKSASGKLKDWR
jgi:hypothetical protein